MKKLWLLPCLAASLMAADISGKWIGNVVVDDPGGGSVIDTQVRAEFVQKADAITGAIGRQDDQQSRGHSEREVGRHAFDLRGFFDGNQWPGQVRAHAWMATIWTAK